MFLELEEISRSFGGVNALSRVSFCVEAGTIHGLIGPNGSGKTTLINVVSGLAGPDSGRLLLDGAPIHRLPPYRIAALGVARTFQNIRLFSNLTCLENVIAGQHLRVGRALVPRLLRLPSARLEERQGMQDAMGCLSRVGIENRALVPAGSLSYGERRRLEIARALALAPASFASRRTHCRNAAAGDRGNGKSFSFPGAGRCHDSSDRAQYAFHNEALLKDYRAPLRADAHHGNAGRSGRSSGGDRSIPGGRRLEIESYAAGNRHQSGLWPCSGRKGCLVSHRRRVDRFADRTKRGRKEHDPECVERSGAGSVRKYCVRGRDITEWRPTKGLPGE